MFIDIRTHLISLVAVFLALGIGILVGVDMIGGQGLVNQEKALASRLELDFDRLRMQNSLLAQQLDNEQRAMSAEESFANQAAAALVSGRLNGMHIALVIGQSGFQDPNLLNILRAAGATVGPIIVMNPARSVSPNAWQSVEAELGVTSQAQVYGTLASAAVEGLTSGNWPGVVLKVPVWQVSGSLHQPVTGVVVVSGGSEAVDPVLTSFTIPLVKMLQQAGVTVVAGETTDVAVSHIPEFAALGVTTVDDLDLTPGLVATVLGLDGVHGDFGVKATAEKLVPDLPTPPPPPKP